MLLHPRLQRRSVTPSDEVAPPLRTREIIPPSTAHAGADALAAAPAFRAAMRPSFIATNASGDSAAKSSSLVDLPLDPLFPLSTRLDPVGRLSSSLGTGLALHLHGLGAPRGNLPQGCHQATEAEDLLRERIGGSRQKPSGLDAPHGRN